MIVREKKKTGSDAPISSGPTCGLQMMPPSVRANPMSNRSTRCPGALKTSNMPMPARAAGRQSADVRLAARDHRNHARWPSRTVIPNPFYTPLAVEIRTVGVVGCGLMGSGIAEVCARAGYTTLVREINDELLASGRQRIERSMSTAVDRGKLEASKRDAALDRLRGTTSLEDLSACDLVIEAATENPAIKKETFRELDRVCPPHAILASNTSSIPIIQMATATRRPDKVLGMHFMNPVPVMPLIEYVRALTTSDETLEMARTFGESLGKRIIVSKDRAGFIVNFLLVPYLTEAVRMLEQGFATKEDIDVGMMLGTSYPMGPFTLLDFVGLDTTLYIADILFDEFKDPRFAAPTLLRQMVAAGYLGRKTGRGFYDYQSGEQPPAR